MILRRLPGTLIGATIVVLCALVLPRLASAQELVPLRVETSPSGAEVYVDGQKRGETPLAVRLPEGEHKLFLYKKAMLPVERTVKLVPGSRPTIKVPLREQRGGLVVLSDPPGARVGFDGRPLGRTPLAFESLPAGSHELTIRKGGFNEFRDTVAVDDRVPNVVNVRLQGPPVSVFVSAERGSRLYVDGSFAGEVTRESMTLRIRAGTHEFRIEKDGFASVQTVRLDPGQDAFVEPGPMSRIPGMAETTRKRLDPRWYVVAGSSGIALIGGVVGGISLYQAHQAREEYEEGFRREEIADAKERIELGNRLFVGGAVVMAAGAAGAWWFWPDGEEDESGGPKASLGGDRFMLSWRF